MCRTCFCAHGQKFMQDLLNFLCQKSCCSGTVAAADKCWQRRDQNKANRGLGTLPKATEGSLLIMVRNYRLMVRNYTR